MVRRFGEDENIVNILKSGTTEGYCEQVERFVSVSASLTFYASSSDDQHPIQFVLMGRSQQGVVQKGMWLTCTLSQPEVSDIFSTDIVPMLRFWAIVL